jgi:hypothetical protein
MTVLVATDLDRTVIYSASAAGVTERPMVAVERHEGADTSFMTVRAADAFARLHESAVVVPVTTRVPTQYERVHLPGPTPRYAVTTNGGELHVDGRADPEWSAQVARRLGGVAPLPEIWDHVARVCRPDWTMKLRNARGMFCYAVVHRKRVPSGFVDETAAWAQTRGWRMSVQGRKFYWVPAPLTKSAAVAEVAARVGATTVLAAGDSLLDLDFLLAADHAIVPAHGEILAAGVGHGLEVTTRSGVAAGEQIVDWFADRAGRSGVRCREAPDMRVTDPPT